MMVRHRGYFSVVFFLALLLLSTVVHGWVIVQSDEQESRAWSWTVAERELQARALVELQDDYWESLLPSGAIIEQRNFWSGEDELTGNPYEIVFEQWGMLTVSLVDMDGPLTWTLVTATSTYPKLTSSSAWTMPNGAPFPDLLFGTRYRREALGSSSSPNALLFTFDEPVIWFGAWFGSVPTRTDGLGLSWKIILFDADSTVITEEFMQTSTSPQADCPIDQNDAYASWQWGCGKATTRWLWFYDESQTVRHMLVVVGDDDLWWNGGTERLSFVGPTMAWIWTTGDMWTWTNNDDPSWVGSWENDQMSGDVMTWDQLDPMWDMCTLVTCADGERPIDTDNDGCRDTCIEMTSCTCPAGLAWQTCRQPAPSFCIAEYDPVCGCNGVTYSNSCEAMAAWVRTWRWGACEEPLACVCPDGRAGTRCRKPVPSSCSSEYNPVCGCDGATYTNKCTAFQAGIRTLRHGACEQDVQQQTWLLAEIIFSVIPSF